MARAGGDLTAETVVDWRAAQSNRVRIPSATSTALQDLLRATARTPGISIVRITDVQLAVGDETISVVVETRSQPIQHKVCYWLGSDSGRPVRLGRAGPQVFVDAILHLPKHPSRTPGGEADLCASPSGTTSVRFASPLTDPHLQSVTCCGVRGLPILGAASENQVTVPESVW